MGLVDRRIDVEHDAIGMWVLERETEIGLADQSATASKVGRGRSGLLERIGEPAEGLRAHRGQDVGLVLEITVGSLGTAAQRLGKLAHSDAFIPETRESLGRDLAKLGAEVGDILFGKIARHDVPYTLCTER